MKRVVTGIRLILLLSMMLPLILADDTVSSSEAAWTFMVYLDGDNNLEEAAIADFLEMSSVGSTDEVNIIVQFDRASGYCSSYDGWSDCKRFFIEKGIFPWPQKSIQDLGEVNMADPNTLKDFIRWAMTDYPANHYCLVLWNHGSGCLRSKIYRSPMPPEKTNVLKDVCWDESHLDYISTVELKEALNGIHLDIVWFDACLMGMIEIAYQIKDNVDYVVASQAVTLGSSSDGSCPYNTVLTDLTIDPSMNGEIFSCLIVDKYGEYWTTTEGHFHQAATMSAIDAGRLTSLGLDVDALAQQLMDNLSPSIFGIRQSRDGVEIYYNDMYIDLYHFAELIKEMVSSEKIRSAANNVTIAVDEVVLNEWHYENNSAHPNSHGLSIYFPEQNVPSTYYNRDYDEFDFAKETSWDEFINKYAFLHWPMFHHDPEHVGYSQSPAPQTNTTLWTYQTMGPIHSSPTAADGMVFVGSNDHFIYALNQRTGALMWSYETGGPVFSSPAVTDGMVFVGSEDNKIYALDEFTGTLIWSYETDGSVHSSPVVAYDLVYVGSTDGNMYALDEFTGELNWTRSETVELGFSSPAFNNAWIYVGSADGRLCVFLFDGWEYFGEEYFRGSWDIGGRIDSSPTIAHGTVFVGSNDGGIYALGSGGVKWNYTTGGSVGSSPAVAHSRVFVGSNDSKVYAFNETTGGLLWSYRTQGPVLSSPAVADSLVFIGSGDNRIYALDELTGSLVWSYETGGPVYSSPAIVDGMVFVGSNDGKIYAFGEPWTKNWHDIAVESVEPYRTVLETEYLTCINVVVENQGCFIEIFNLTLCCDSDIIGIQNLTLSPFQSMVLGFEWTTPEQLGNYTLTATVDPVLGETDTGDSTLTFDLIQISIVGDINADGTVNILDIATAAKAYQSYPEHPEWDANADVNEDRVINIMDIATIAKEYGKTI